MIELKCCDFLDGLKALPDRSIDVVVTSPRYNQGVAYDVVNDDTPREEYYQELLWLSRLLQDKLTVGGSFFLNLPANEGGLQAFLLTQHQWTLQNTFCWVKSFSEDEETTAGHFRPFNSEHYVHRCFEMVYHLTVRGDVKIDRKAIGVTYQDKSNLKRFGHTEDKRCSGNVWYIPIPTLQKGNEHPATFPVELPKKCILLHGLNKRPFVCDPFCGSGATLVAAQELGLNGLGIDISEKYIGLSKERLGL